MKKVFILSAIILVSFASCKRKQSCPAYGKTLLKPQTESIKA